MTYHVYLNLKANVKMVSFIMIYHDTSQYITICNNTSDRGRFHNITLNLNPNLNPNTNTSFTRYITPDNLDVKFRCVSVASHLLIPFIKGMVIIYGWGQSK